MAPAVVRRAPSGEQIGRVAHAITSTLSSLSTRAANTSETPLASIFALIIGRSNVLSKRAATVLSESFVSSEVGITTAPLQLAKRQNAILAIPTTYKGLDAGPAPGAIVGIILGSIAGFILCLYILLLAFQAVGGRNKTVVEKEVIVHRRNRSRSRSRHTVITERPPSPPPSLPPPRRPSRRETIVIEEHVHMPPRRPSPRRSPRRSPPREPTPELDEVIVEEDESLSEEMVEVIEEESTMSPSIRPPSPPPAKPPPRKESRRSGFRTVDPAEFGGGDAPLRRVKKR